MATNRDSDIPKRLRILCILSLGDSNSSRGVGSFESEDVAGVAEVVAIGHV